MWSQLTGTAQQVFEWGEGGQRRMREGIFFFGGGGGGAGEACLWISIQFLLSNGECYYNDLLNPF